MPLVIALLTASFLLTWFGTPKISDLLVAGGAARKNYAGKDIPTAAGLSIIVSVTGAYFFAFVFVEVYRLEIMSSVAVVLGMGLLGLIDDLLGTREITGLKGHISMLLKGKCTTGGLKAIWGGGLAFGFSLVFSSGIVEVLVNTFLIALFTNAVNLTDLRPGRAAKAFLFIGFFLMVSAFFLGSHSILVLGPAFGAVLAFLPYDLKGMVMLGDTGSNVMGIILGIVSVLLLPILVKSIILGMLVLLHIYTEKYSLTETIQKITFLRRIDEWGTSR